MDLFRFRNLGLGLTAASVLLLGACGGGGGGDTAATADADGSTDSGGNVAVLLTDAPTDIYEQINVTVTGITLLPREDSDEEAISLLDEPRTLDILALRDYSELLTVAEDVPVGEYEKVRLNADRVELVDEDTEEPPVEARLPSGHIDLVPDEALRVSQDNTLYLELDIDADNSLLVVETGTGERLFRPVVLVNTYEEDTPGDGTAPAEDGDDADDGTNDDELADGNGDDGMAEDDDTPIISVSGSIRRFMDDDELLVCPSAQASDRACVEVESEEDTAVFDTLGSSIELATLVEGDAVIAIGELDRDEDSGRRQLEAFSITLGTRPTIGTRGGVAAGPVNEEGIFSLRNGRAIALADTTPVVDGDGDRLSRDAIADGRPLTVKGVIDDPLRASLVILRGDDDEDDEDDEDADDGDLGTAPAEGDDDGESAPTRLEGDLIAADTADTIQVDVNGTATWVRLVDGGALIVSGRGRVSTPDLTTLDANGRTHIKAFGSDGESYFEAERIIAITMGRDEAIEDDDDDDDQDDEEDDDEDDDDDDGRRGPPEGVGPPDRDDD
ncbi:DUF4382 domain-containing protein [Arhodomonas sp. SL1]|uniref:DUF4382 domain-containing protein n=1 Tax=Arhodomonas sp. SL1 TaxID=3425691 RepID=UPI003F882D9E